MFPNCPKRQTFQADTGVGRTGAIRRESVMPTWSMWTILVFLLIVRGLFAAMEAALQALSDDRAKELAKAGSHRARRLYPATWARRWDR
jgi:hypothetical protein